MLRARRTRALHDVDPEVVAYAASIRPLSMEGTGYRRLALELLAGAAMDIAEGRGDSRARNAELNRQRALAWAHGETACAPFLRLSAICAVLDLNHHQVVAWLTNGSLRGVSSFRRGVKHALQSRPGSPRTGAHSRRASN